LRGEGSTGGGYVARLLERAFPARRGVFAAASLPVPPGGAGAEPAEGACPPGYGVVCWLAGRARDCRFPAGRGADRSATTRGRRVNSGLFRDFRRRLLRDGAIGVRE